MGYNELIRMSKKRFLIQTTISFTRLSDQGSLIEKESKDRETYRDK